jgi:hypothetical protein
MKVSLSDLEDAPMFADAGMDMDASVYLDREIGKIYYAGDVAVADELPEDLKYSERYRQIPDKHSLGLGQSLVFDFVRERLPDDYDEVHDIFRRRGAYRRFKDFLENKDLLDAWHEYENEQTLQALRDWCESEGI